MTGNEPMTDERLAAIKRQMSSGRWLLAQREVRRVLEAYVHELLAEVDRLRAENAAMRPIVEAVAEAAVGDEYGGGSWLMFAGYDAETIREHARAFVAAHPAAESEA